MKKLTVFNFITINGYFKGPNEDISWHRHGEEEGKFSEENMKSQNTLLFGRITYEHMAAFWPTPMAMQNMPAMAEGMNNADKIVFSKTLQKADWQNTRIINSDLIEAVKKLKETNSKDMTVLGSGTIITQLADAGLIDSYQIMIDPVAINAGTPIFNGIHKKLDLQLTNTRTFKSGVVMLSYVPM